MAVASISCRCRARAFVSDALFSRASGRDIPAVTNRTSGVVGAAVPSLPPASSRTVCSTARSLASSSRCSRVNGSPGASMSCTPRLTASPSAMHSQSQSTNSMRPSGGSGAMSGTTITRDAGTPIAEPSAPSTSTRLRNSPMNRKAMKAAMRSHAISRTTIQTSRAAPRPTVTPAIAKTEPSSVAALSSCVIRYMTINASSACGIRWVRIGMVAITHASVRRKAAAPRPGVGASSRRKKPPSAAAVTASRACASPARWRPPRLRSGRSRPDPRP